MDQQGSEAGNSTDDAYYTRGIFAFDLGTGVPRNTSTTSDASISTGVQPCFTGPRHRRRAGQLHANAALVNEGLQPESMEFADGAWALFSAALAYANDVTAPAVVADPARRPESARYGCSFDRRRCDRRLLHDGRLDADARLDCLGTARGRWTAAPPLKLTQTTTVRWIAVDVKGNVSAVQSRTITVS